MNENYKLEILLSPVSWGRGLAFQEAHGCGHPGGPGGKASKITPEMRSGAWKPFKAHSRITPQRLSYHRF